MAKLIGLAKGVLGLALCLVLVGVLGSGSCHVAFRSDPDRDHDDHGSSTLLRTEGAFWPLDPQDLRITHFHLLIESRMDEPHAPRTWALVGIEGIFLPPDSPIGVGRIAAFGHDVIRANADLLCRGEEDRLVRWRARRTDSGFDLQCDLECREGSTGFLQLQFDPRGFLRSVVKTESSG